MKLYYAPGACSLSPHIVAREGDLPVDISKVTFNPDGTRTTADGEDFFAVNAKGGYVPALRLDDGSVIAEGPAIVLTLAHAAEGKGLTPTFGSPEYFKVVEWLAFIGTEIHKGFANFFRQDAPEQEKTISAEKLTKRFSFVDQSLAGKEYLMGSTFSVADAYLYTIIRWMPKASLTLSSFPNLAAFVARMETRPGVTKALEEEGLSPFAA